MEYGHVSGTRIYSVVDVVLGVICGKIEEVNVDGTTAYVGCTPMDVIICVDHDIEQLKLQMAAYFHGKAIQFVEM